MQDKAKVQLAAALAATLGFAISSNAGAANSVHLQLPDTDRQSPFYIASGNADDLQQQLSSKGKDGSCKGKGGRCMFKHHSKKGKEGSCKGKQGSCKGKDGSCKGKDGSCKGKDSDQPQSK